MSENYTADDITMLEGLASVRKRPGMYIGSTDSSGLQHLVWEIFDNSVDEAIAGYAKTIEISLNADGSVEVHDDGRGIPTGINKKTGLSGVELALTTLHAGGKFGGGGYKSAGGLHGVGSSVVNALSSRMEATVYQGGKAHSIAFQRGTTGVFAGEGPDAKFTPKKGLVTTPDKRSAADKKKRPTGTSIRWWSDPTIFTKDAVLDYERILDRARTTSFLVPGVTIIVTNNTGAAPTTESFNFAGGVHDMVEHLATDAKLHDVIVINEVGKFTEKIQALQEDGSLETEDVEREVDIRVALRWGNKYDYKLRSFVNVVSTPNGGTHVRGFERGLNKAVIEAAKSRRGMIKANEENPTFEDISEGLTAVVSVGFPEPQFIGQTKDALGTSDITKLVQTATYDAISAWMNHRRNATVSKTVLEKVVTASRNRQAARSQRELARRKTALQGASMPAKLVDCSSHDTIHTELHIVEGDSALGSMRGARDSQYQALLPIRGKIINAHKAKPADLLKNAEVSDIIQVIGAGAGKTFDVDAMRYGRIIITADADSDGGHIRTLLISLFWNQMRPLVEAGRLYSSVPPLFAVKTSGKNGATHYFLSDEDANKQIAKWTKSGVKFGDKIRFKGLGEMNYEELGDTTLNPESRILRQITVDDVTRAEAMLELAMGDAVAPRKEWISSNRSLVADEELDI